MTKIIEDKWFKIIISLSVIIVAGSAAYYFLVYLPIKDKRISSQQVAQIDQNNAQQCAEVGQKYFDANFSEYKQPNFQVILSGPFFHYNKKLNACLMEYKLDNYDVPINIGPVGGDYRFDGYIINLLTGNTEAFVTAFWKNGTWMNDANSQDYQRFENQEMDLMQN